MKQRPTTVPFEPEVQTLGTFGQRKQEPGVKPDEPTVITEELGSRLPRCAAALEAVCSASEADFMRLGAQLNTIHEDAQQLTQNVMAILASDQELTIQGALKAIQTHATDALEDLRHCHKHLASDIAHLKGMQDQLRALLDQNDGFKKVAKNLKMVGLNISIESARDPQAKNAFQTLAEEIVDLARTVRTVTRDIGDDTSASRKSLEAIQSQTGQRSQHMNEIMASTRDAVADALDQVERLMQRNVAALDNIGVKAREIAEQVGHLVVGIQIHDNINQRATHINTSLGDTVALLTDYSTTGPPARQAEQSLGKAYALVRLQTTQLQIIIEDITAARRQSETALDTLLEAVAAVAGPDGFSADGREQSCLDIAAGPHPVIILKKALERLLSLLNSGVHAMREINEQRRQTGRTITHLGHHIAKVRDINEDVRLKALNAVIKSPRLGKAGKSIEVIVNEMKELAGQSNSAIEAVATILENVTAASDITDKKSRAAQMEMDSAGQELREGIKAFAAACDTFKDRSRIALQMGKQLRDKIIQSRKDLVFFKNLENDLRAQYTVLQQTGASLQPFADTAPGDWMEKHKAIRRRYTMERERQIHQTVSSGENPSGGKYFGTAGNPAAALPPKEELGDNIELF